MNAGWSYAKIRLISVMVDGGMNELDFTLAAKRV
jgi:hypothetical protein